MNDTKSIAWLRNGFVGSLLLIEDSSQILTDQKFKIEVLQDGLLETEVTNEI